MFPRASEEERAEVVRRHQAGETFAQIEAATGWSRCFIGRVCHAAGLRRFEIDAAAVERLAGQRLTAKQIAARLGVKTDTVRSLAKRRGIPLVHDVTSGGAGVPRRIETQRSPLGQALQDLRIQRGQTSDQAAHAADMSPASYHSMEKGKRRPRPEALRKLAAFLQVEEAELVALVPEGGWAKKYERRAPPKDPSIAGLEGLLVSFRASLRRAAVSATEGEGC